MPDLLGQLKVALADRYTVERELGRGGMAVVYLAQDLRPKRRVALKVLRPELAAPLGADRFLREIELACAPRGRRARTGIGTVASVRQSCPRADRVVRKPWGFRPFGAG